MNDHEDGAVPRPCPLALHAYVLTPGEILEFGLLTRSRCGKKPLMQRNAYHESLVEYIRTQAQPPDKFSHQARLHRLASSLAEGAPLDEDILFAAAWLHDLGVFVGHRPEDLEALKTWDHLAYALKQTPAILVRLGFPNAKIEGVLDAIRNHMPSGNPKAFEGILLRDADILEQLGAVGILRTVSKVGRDTRFKTFADALDVLRKNMTELPGKLRLNSARKEAQPRLEIMRSFLAASETEAEGIQW